MSSYIQALTLHFPGELHSYTCRKKRVDGNLQVIHKKRLDQAFLGMCQSQTQANVSNAQIQALLPFPALSSSPENFHCPEIYPKGMDDERTKKGGS